MRATKSPSHVQGWRTASLSGPLSSPEFPFVTGGSEARAHPWRWKNNPSHLCFAAIYSLAAWQLPSPFSMASIYRCNFPTAAQDTKRHSPGNLLPPAAALGYCCPAELFQQLQSLFLGLLPPTDPGFEGTCHRVPLNSWTPFFDFY